MDRWKDDDAVRVARELQTGPHVSVGQQSTTANCGVAVAPEAAVDALVEAAWAFPGLRVSYAAWENSRTLRFHTSAGAESQSSLDCVRLDFAAAPRLVEALRLTDAPTSFEDVSTDSRSRPIADALAEIGCGSMLILPLMNRRKPVGIVMLDAAAPRTWGAKEIAALDRLAPLVTLSLEHVQAKAELESTRSNGTRHERRIAAIRGLTAGVAMDADRILTALRDTVETDRQATHSLLDQLDRLVAELDRVQRGPSRLTEPFELAAALRSIAPGLSAVTPANVRLEERHDGVVGVVANRTGIERLLVNLIVHASRNADPGQSLTVELTGGDQQRPRVRLYGDALHVDAALLRLVGDDPLETSEQVCAALWQARCEALVQDIRIWVDDDAIVLELPAAQLPRDAAKSAG